MAEISCAQFADILSRRSEHLDDEILKDLTPKSTLIGMVETGQFNAQDGVSHTFDKFNRVFPDMSVAWEDVTAEGCIGTPCDPTETKIGMGYTRDSYKLQKKSYATDLFCYDLIMSADRAKQQFAHTVGVLRDATNLIVSNRLRNEMLRIAGHWWATGATGLTAITWTETGDLINVTPTTLPTTLLNINMLRQRVQYQILSGATDQVVAGAPPEIEVVTDMDTVWAMMHDSNLTDHWRFSEFATGAVEYYKYGWTGRIGNFMLHADMHPIRFQINGNTLSRVFPYENTAATQGIKGVPNDDYINAPVQVSFIWHRRGMRSLVRDNTSIHPLMPFAARDFGGKWQFVMDNLTCGYYEAPDGTKVPIAVDNARRNKGKFIADFSFATQAQFPEYVEAIFHMRENPCVVGVPPCAETPDYVSQDFDSHNDPCED